MHLRSVVLLIGGLVAAFTVTACGENASDVDADAQTHMADSSGSSPMAGEGAEVDVAFAQLMIVHHQQAVEMAGVALEHGESTDVKTLAAQINDAQGPEIEQMTGWLEEWDAPMDMSEGVHDMGGMAMSGMMTDDDMASLAELRGAAFDRMWLRMMIVHHEGAIQMARDVLEESSNAEVTALAEAIVDGQTVEINNMQQLLAG